MNNSLRVALAICLLLPTFAPAQNKFGIMTHLTASTFDLSGGAHHIQMASDLCGEWGWVRQYVSANPDDAETHARFLLLCRAHKLRPILYINHLGHDRLISEGRALAPRPDEDGERYTETAAYIARWLEAIESHGVEVPYLEVWNEPNLHEGWGGSPDPREYARYHVDVVDAVRKVSPNTQFLNAALSPSGGTEDNGDGNKGRLGDHNLDNLYFIDEMMDEMPDLGNYFDYWSSHSYPLNHPPDYHDDRFSITGYQWELRHLKPFGARKPVIITETGYKLGEQPDTRFPRVTDALRTGWIVWAYFESWLDDPELVAVCPFLLGDPLWGEIGMWDNYTWLDKWQQPTPMFDAVASLPRQPGTDYLENGGSVLEGTAWSTRLNKRSPLANALVWVLPGGYAAMTGEQGRFRIEGIPAGDYTLLAEAADHARSAAAEVSLGEETAARHDTLLPFTGLLANSDFEKAPRVYDENNQGEGIEPTEDSSNIAHETIRGPHGNNTMAVQIENYGAIYDDTDYISVRAGETYKVTINYRAEGRATVTMRAELFRSHTPNESEVPVQAVVKSNGSDGWQRLEIAVEPRDIWTQRLRVILAADTAPGKPVWFDDLTIERQVNEEP